MTRRELIQLMANAEYWRDREETQRATYIRTEEEEMREINQIYNEMYRWAEREISAFYGRYADAEGIDITEAKRRVSQMDIEAYERLAKQYVADRDFSDRANQEMRLYNATMRINRMELLKAQMGLKMVDGFNDIDKHYEKIATDRAVQEIQRMSGILGNTLTDVQTAKIAKNIVNADFYNATFSERIWMHADNLKDALATELNKGFISGVSSQKMAQNIKKQFEVSYKDAHRLVVTELRRIQTDVAKDNYERQGIEEYEYMAVNPNACPICKDLDGKVYKVSEMQAGLNAPPIHPNCHCTTAPKVNETEYEQWLTWLEQGGTTAQWDQMSPTKRQNWYDSIVQSIPKKTTASEIRTRADAEKALLDMGFVLIEDSVGRLPDDVLVSQVKRLQSLEKRFGMVGKSATPCLSAMNSGNALAYVSHRISDPHTQNLSLCSKYYSQGLQYMTDEAREAVNSKWSMPCADNMLEWYTVTHEYGHMIHNILLYENIDSIDTFKTRATTLEGKYKAYSKYQSKVLGEWNKEIIEIAKKNNPNFVLSDNISRYGKTNNAEFFAEVFANSQCGDPNELGKAMNEWLKEQGL